MTIKLRLHPITTHFSILPLFQYSIGRTELNSLENSGYKISQTAQLPVNSSRTTLRITSIGAFLLVHNSN